MLHRLHILLALSLLIYTGACARAANETVDVLRAEALPLNNASDLDPIIERAGDRRLTLLGEASHGTSEYYTWRTAISRRLIEEKGYRFIAVEGDWVTCFRLNRYAKGLTKEETSARQIMQTFDRWPTWMWANEEVAELIEWLREYNLQRPEEERVGFYGIDVYGEEAAQQKVLQLLESKDADIHQRVAELYACLDSYAGDMGRYARSVAMGRASCGPHVARVVSLLQENREQLEREDPYTYFHLKQLARVVMGAERHYRAMAMQNADSWNFRVDHFADTVDRLLDRYGPDAKGVVWAHNTHIGDARATSMGARGQRNIGQLARQKHGEDQVFAVGFGTYRGTVVAGRQWGAPRQVMRVPDAVEGSLEARLKEVGIPQAIFLTENMDATHPLGGVLGHRAIGVMYQPAQEQGNYVPTLLSKRYNAFVYIEETKALRPIDP